MLKAVCVAAVGAGLSIWAAPVLADNPMQTCGARYQAAKAAHSLPAGQSWNQYLAQCRGTLKAPAAASPASSTHALAPAAGPGAKATGHLPGAQSAEMIAMHDRQRRCGAQWQADKAAGKIAAGEKWPQYWSTCNARLKS